MAAKRPLNEGSPSTYQKRSVVPKKDLMMIIREAVTEKQGIELAAQKCVEILNVTQDANLQKSLEENIRKEYLYMVKTLIPKNGSSFSRFVERDGKKNRWLDSYFEVSEEIFAKSARTEHPSPIAESAGSPASRPTRTKPVKTTPRSTRANPVVTTPTTTRTKADGTTPTSARTKAAGTTPTSRPLKPYEELHERQQGNRVKQVMDQLKGLELKPVIKGFQRFLRKRGKNELAELIGLAEDASIENINEATKVLKSQTAKPYSLPEAVYLMIDSSLSTRNYHKLRMGALEHGIGLYPPYKQVVKEREHCRPSGIEVSETRAVVPLQNLLQHTTQRIIESQTDVIQQFSDEELQDVLLILSWGYDSSTGHSPYKQNFEESSRNSSFNQNVIEQTDDSSVFQQKVVNTKDNCLLATSVIPLRMVTSSDKIVWNNPSPQSVNFCRPKKIEFIDKEDNSTILKERDDMLLEIDQLTPVVIITTHGSSVTVKFSMHLTLIDGKVLSIITKCTSMRQCPICHASPKQFNQNLATIIENTKYGLSPLHCYLRMYEFLLNIAYRIDFKAYEVRKNNPEHKRLFDETKAHIQQQFREKMGLLVGVVKSGGFGNTNDGNSSRKAFKNYKLFAEITKLDETFVRKIRNVLISISLPYNIDHVKFGEYCQTIVDIYQEKYQWYTMSTTAHRLLKHGAEVIKESILPVGMLSEEAAESRHKIFKSDRLLHARKVSRPANMTDVFRRALDSSDPLLSMSLVSSRLKNKNRMALPLEVINLLQVPADPAKRSETFNVVPEQGGEGAETFEDVLDNFEMEVEIETSEFSI